MKCFYHPDRDAVGLCRSCMKGLCTECAVDMTKGLACHGACQKDVADILALTEQNIRHAPLSDRIMKNYGKGSSALGILVLLLALGLLVIGGRALAMGDDAVNPLIFGVVCLLYGGYLSWTARQVRK